MEGKTANKVRIKMSAAFLLYILQDFTTHDKKKNLNPKPCILQNANIMTVVEPYD